jgi:hypothetical protein
VLGLYLPPGVQGSEVIRIPNRPPRRSFHCQATLPCDTVGSGCVVGGGGRPTIRAGIVSPAGVQVPKPSISSTPDDHFTASPYCCVKESGTGRAVVLVAPSQLSVPGVYLPPVLERSLLSSSTPDDHFDCQSTLPYDGIGQWARWSWWWRVQLSVPGLYLPPVFKRALPTPSPPRRSFQCHSRLPCDSIAW